MFENLLSKFYGVCQLSVVTSCITTAHCLSAIGCHFLYYYSPLSVCIWQDLNLKSTAYQPIFNYPNTADTECQISPNSVQCDAHTKLCANKFVTKQKLISILYPIYTDRFINVLHTSLTPAKWWRHATPAAHLPIPSPHCTTALQLYAPPTDVSRNSAFVPSVFVFNVTIRTAIVSLCRLNWLVFITETKCVFSAS